MLTLIFPLKVKCPSLADFPMSFCSPFAPHSLWQLLPSAAVAERSPCTSAAEAALITAATF